MTKIRKAYEKHERKSISFIDDEGNHDGMTEQHHKSAVDINNIIRQHDRTGIITHVNRSVASYGDYTEVNEYQECLNRVIAADNAFSALPAHVREKFKNDPGEFFEFATNPENHDEMVELGLANPKPLKTKENQQAAAEPEQLPT